MNPPAVYTNTGIMMVISGLLNILASLIWVFLLSVICVGVLWLVPLALGVWELITGTAMSNGTRQPNARLAAMAGLAAALLTCNVIGIALEIIAITRLGSTEVIQWLASEA